MNLYLHFPFCRSKCAYCALHSYVGRSEAERARYVDGLLHQLRELFSPIPQPETRNQKPETRNSKPGTQNSQLSTLNPQLSTLYFGGGTPALCNLQPLLDFLTPHLSPPIPQHETRNPEPGTQNSKLKTLNSKLPTEFTVELNPLDVSPKLLRQLKAGGVNRLSMGVQSFDEATLRAMGRPHTAEQARTAWRQIREAGFDNAGIDLICGWPAERRKGAISDAWKRTLDAAAEVAPDHCSVYTLILEPKTRLAHDVANGRVSLPSDDVALAELAAAEQALAAIGLERYEISSFAKPGRECRHNLTTWRGEDYIGIGDGACSREGNAVSRVIFRLRLLKEGFSPVQAAADFPELAPRVDEWCATLDRFTAEGLLTTHTRSLNPHPETQNSEPGTLNSKLKTLNSKLKMTYRLTPRGAEVCDTILAELV